MADRSRVQEEVAAANARFAASFSSGDLAAAPRRRFAIVTCMDARIDPAKVLGLAAGDANVIRNAGAIVTDDALRSLAISHWLLGTEEALVIGHTDCGMAKFTDEELRERVRSEAGSAADDVVFLAFSNVEETVREGVRRIESSPLLPASFHAAGFVYDVGTGRLQPLT